MNPPADFSVDTLVGGFDFDQNDTVAQNLESFDFFLPVLSKNVDIYFGSRVKAFLELGLLTL